MQQISFSVLAKNYTSTKCINCKWTSKKKFGVLKYKQISTNFPYLM